MAEELIADMGQYVMGHEPIILTALGLGSCIGCIIYDKEKKIGGLAHVMLPQSKECIRENKKLNLNKFADIVIPAMVEELKKQGCKIENMVSKIAGGGHMFAGIIHDEVMDIGRRNDEAVREQLKNLGIHIIAHETRGNTGRTIRFDTTTGKLSIKTKDNIKEI